MLRKYSTRPGDPSPSGMQDCVAELESSVDLACLRWDQGMADISANICENNCFIKLTAYLVRGRLES